MVSKNDIKEIRLLSQKKYRELNSLFIAEGDKLVQEAIDSGFEIVMVLCTEKSQISYHRAEIVSEATMEKATSLNSPSPSLAVIRIPAQTDANEIESIIRSKPLCLALDGVRDPGNLGTILRIADWFGIDCIFASPDTVDLYNPKTVQSTMGAIFRKKVIYTPLQPIMQSFAQAGMPVYGTLLDGDNIYRQSLRSEGLIVMGSESEGIRKDNRHLVTDKLYIPSYPADSETSESLNVAIATAVICAEFRRPDSI
ncbi:MAG: RNA methyltransferase [Bacteroidales bacterium]|nr:RNA methyltransferase [Bacteroidales bacterium]